MTMPSDLEYDEAIMDAAVGSISQPSTESCLVQIYPPDVVDGMLKLGSNKIVIGRESSSTCVLPDTSVSRRHAEISPSDEGFKIRDLESTNGTLVNGQRVKEHTLDSGDTIQVGSFLFRFLTAGSVESKYHETVYSALTQDALTGTMNRRYLVESLRREISRANRNGEMLSLTMIDIDHFKRVNDSYGHLIGDEVLREFGKRIESVKRDDDLLARFGGEEFCLVLAATSPEETEDMLEKCRAAIADKKFETAASKINITASFGYVCVQPFKVIQINDIIEAADELLYAAKKAGRDRVCGQDSFRGPDNAES